MVKQDKIATIHYQLIDTIVNFGLEWKQWEWNDEKFESFALFNEDHILVACWQYCPLYPEIIEAIEKYLE